MQTEETQDVEILIVGSGFAGLGLGALLRRSGRSDFLIIERAGSVGGTWRDNTYPGAACDIQSHLYSLSFHLNPDWSRTYATQPEIRGYLEDVATGEGLQPHLRFGAELLRASWNPNADRWLVETTAGTYRPRFLVAATGHLSDPRLPDIEGIADFAGPVFHSARWDHEVDLCGLRVGVVGTGASSIQLVPAIADRTRSVTVFQRSAPYVIPRIDHEFTEAERRTFARVPAAMQELRDHLFWANEARYPQRRLAPEFLAGIADLARHHREAQVADPVLLARVTPDYVIGCKRILLSNDWYPTLARSDVSLVTEPIAAVDSHRVRTRSGVAHEVDVLVLSTGFEATDLPIAHRITGRGGVLLADQWARGGQAFSSVAVHGFPNLFLMNGPNSGLGAGSVVYMIETQAEYIRQALDFGRDRDAVVLEVDPGAEEEYVRTIDERAAGTVWLAGGCSSWYVDDRSGRLTTLWPDMMNRYRSEFGTFDAGAYLPGPMVAADH